MSKFQIILVVLGVGLVVALYSLPKIIVKNNRQQVESGREENSNADIHASDTLHDLKIPEATISKINVFKESLKNASRAEDKTRFADSISSLYQSSKRLDSAAKYKELIAEIAPTGENFENAGDLYAEAANFSVDQDKQKSLSLKARTYYEKILRETPENLNVKSKLAMTFVTTENPMAGIKMLREVVEKDPNNQVAIFNLGILSVQSGQYTKAVERFEKLIVLNPENWKARFYLGLSYKELGEKQKAKDQFELVKKVEQDPEVLSIADSYLQELK